LQYSLLWVYVIATGSQNPKPGTKA
jgi:hypothetical protein